MSIRLTRYAICFALGIVVIGPPLLAAPSQELSTKATLASFQMGVNDYLAQRWHAIRDLPLPPAGAKFVELVTALDRQRAAVRQARADVRQGNVFSQDVSTLLRGILAFTIKEYGLDVRELLASQPSDVPRTIARPRVNESFPWPRGAAMPIVLIVALPPLPYELQYRLVDRDLILLDMDLGIVIDILPKALPKD
jgi:hypothetical protein